MLIREPARRTSTKGSPRGFDRRVNSKLNEQFGMVVSETKKRTGRNKPCLCGSGKKYKKCCGK